MVAMPEKDVSEEGKSEGHSDEEAGCAQASVRARPPAEYSVGCQAVWLTRVGHCTIRRS